LITAATRSRSGWVQTFVEFLCGIGLLTGALSYHPPAIVAEIVRSLNDLILVGSSVMADFSLDSGHAEIL
jgi:hypothetical protein